MREEINTIKVEPLFCPPLSLTLKDKYYPDSVKLEDPVHFDRDIKRENIKAEHEAIKLRGKLPKYDREGSRTLQTETYPFDRRNAKKVRGASCMFHSNCVVISHVNSPLCQDE